MRLRSSRNSSASRRRRRRDFFFRVSGELAWNPPSKKPHLFVFFKIPCPLVLRFETLQIPCTDFHWLSPRTAPAPRCGGGGRRPGGVGAKRTGPQLEELKHLRWASATGGGGGGGGGGDDPPSPSAPPPRGDSHHGPLYWDSLVSTVLSVVNSTAVFSTITVGSLAPHTPRLLSKPLHR
jgi:hypothetical protein